MFVCVMDHRSIVVDTVLCGLTSVYNLVSISCSYESVFPLKTIIMLQYEVGRYAYYTGKKMIKTAAYIACCNVINCCSWDIMILY